MIYLNINRHSRHLDIRRQGPCSILSTNNHRRILDIKQPEKGYCLYKTPIVIVAILISTSRKTLLPSILNSNRHCRHLDINILKNVTVQIVIVAILTPNSQKKGYCLYQTPIVTVAILTSNSQKKKVTVCIKPQLSPSPS